jgi:hypothetical protein
MTEITPITVDQKQQIIKVVDEFLLMLKHVKTMAETNQINKLLMDQETNKRIVMFGNVLMSSFTPSSITSARGGRRKSIRKFTSSGGGKGKTKTKKSKKKKFNRMKGGTGKWTTKEIVAKSLVWMCAILALAFATLTVSELNFPYQLMTGGLLLALGTGVGHK